MEKFNPISTIVSVFGTIVSFFIGGVDMAIIVLATFMLLDYMTGLVKAKMLKKISSSIGFDGIVRKATIFVVLIVAVLLDRLLNMEQMMFRSLVIYFYIANEGISILENCAAIGLPLPEGITDAFEQLKKGNKKSKE